ncbi:ATP-binding protein [Prevotella sp. LMAG:51]|uniref:sensor histidine kinase n=2 Tax=Prevotellaceae TaxID=171552 RepID=UPI002593FD1F|nr:ATP-binding protein [uncultured Prevotella sp.]
MSECYVEKPDSLTVFWKFSFLLRPFFRAKNTRSIKGHGVGLALSKAIIEKMGGKVSVHSIEGEGTTLDIKV